MEETKMATGKKKTRGTGRREFLVGTGAALTFGAVAGLGGRIGSTAVVPAADAIAGRIEHDATLCAGCGVCSLMCSLYHEKETRVSLSRTELVRDPFEGNYSINVCRQCLSPSCYQSCPKKHSALCIDQTTGIKYVNAEKCDGCAKCTRGCPLKPARIKLNAAGKVAFKCDLCRDREKGPICVEYCSQHALAIVPGNVGV
jgi:Fe-S-cluster-containing hydrogenase component 2